MSSITNSTISVIKMHFEFLAIVFYEFFERPRIVALNMKKHDATAYTRPKLQIKYENAINKANKITVNIKQSADKS